MLWFDTAWAGVPLLIQTLSEKFPDIEFLYAYADEDLGSNAVSYTHLDVYKRQHELLENGVDVQIGYVETHGRVGTEAMLQGLPVISRRKIFYLSLIHIYKGQRVLLLYPS